MEFKESPAKISRGWKYKEITLDFTKKPTRNDEEDKKPLKGVQITMFQ